MGRRILGLDLGPNSIGWALIDEDEHAIVDLGVRVFPEGVDNFDSSKEVSRNEDRRLARGMRRQTQRRARRRRLLRQALVEAGLFPEDAAEQAKLLAVDPYSLRSRALTEQLTPHEIGRVFYHLSQRRGFLSNRKKDRGDAEVKGILAEMNLLAEEIQKSGAPTLGALLHAKVAQFDHRDRKPNDHVRNRHTLRQMYLNEFDAIWEAQERLGHAALLTEQLKYGALGKAKYPIRPRRRPRGLSLLQAYGIFGLLFFQRRMYWPRSVIGSCELEPKQPRCPRADRKAQRIRLLQEVNNLRYVDPATRAEQSLSETQRKLLLDKLGKTEKMTFDQIRKALGFLEDIRFNLERGKRPYLLGAKVDALLAKAVGKQWYSRPEEEKDEIVRLLIDNDRDDDEIVELLVQQYGFDKKSAQAAVDVDLPSGYMQLSLKAINRLLPHMERGLIYQSVSDPEKSALHAAGYLRRDELRRRLFDKLPDPKRAKDCPIGDLPNPVVKRTLVELRKVVNAILRTYGKPAEIHVEMGRDVKSRPARGTEAYRKYQEQIDQMREREARRAAAVEKLRENGVTVNRENITRYLLWEDQRGVCIYTGRPISVAQLLGAGGEIQVDHILPYSRCLDDSQNNKVVCFRNANHEKGDRTPYEWLAESRPQQYEEICQRANQLMRDGRIPYPKYRRFLQKELKLDDFIARQLNDTRYIARATAEYLRCLFEADHHVLGMKGQLTAELRHHWGIDNLLAELPDSPAWQEKNDLRPGEKNRADHRHHAIDAVVIALTSRSRLQALSRLRQRGGVEATGELILDPWEGFRDDLLEAVSKVYVSHRAERKVSGRLHEETLYGKTEQEGVWVARKPVDALSPNEIESIRDPGIRQIVVSRLREAGIEFGRGVKVDAKTWKQVLTGLTMPSGVPIKRVRVLKKEQTIRPLRTDAPGAAFVKPGSTHHLCLFEYQDGGKRKVEAVFVTMLEATERLKRGEPIIQRVHPSRPEARFLMSLCRGDMVLAQWQGAERLLVFQTAASTQGQIYFAEHSDGRRSADYKKYVATANSLIAERNARKVTVDPLGRIRWAND